MDYIKDLNHLLDYIETHLDQELNIDHLANKALLSKFYFQRLFQKLVGVNVMAYVRLRRLARAASDIQAGGKITDIAFNYGFNSHETFTRAFKAVYQLTPTAYRKSNIPLTHFYKPDLALKYNVMDMGVPLVSDGIVMEMSTRHVKSDIHLAGVMLECVMAPAGQDNPGIAWGELNKIKDGIKNQSMPCVEWGVSLPGEAEDTFNYLAAVQVDEKRPEHSPFDLFTIPAGQYAVCTFSAEDFFSLTNDAMSKAFNYFLQTWLPNSFYEMVDVFAVEQYDHRCLKEHAQLEKVEVALGEIMDDPLEMDIMVRVKEKQS